MGDPSANPPGRLGRLQDQIRSLTDHDVVAAADAQLSRRHRFAHFWILTVQMFTKNRGPVRAASLAYTTLLALVPLLAISLSVSMLFLPREPKERRAKLVEWIEMGVTKTAPSLGLAVEGGEEQRVKLASQLVEFVERVQFGRITVTAAAGLIVVAIGLLRTIEVALNDIWGVSRGRGLLVSVAFYWAVITLGPVVVVVAKGANYLQMAGPYFGWLHETIIGRWVLGIAVFVSPMLMAVAFGALYYWMPNTRVRWQAALVGGTVAAFLWTLNGKLAALYNTKVLTYNAIYGSLGVLPIFLAGVYLTWLITLFGAQVAYVFQNRKAYLQERIAGRVHQEAREFAAMRIMTLIAARFLSARPPAGMSTVAEELGLPPNLTKDLLRTLTGAGLLTETAAADPAFVPSRPISQITTHDVLTALRSGSGSELSTAADPFRTRVKDTLSRVRAAESAAASAVTLQELAQEPAAPTSIPTPTPSAARA